MNDPRILVTGGSGLLGSYFLRWFKHKGYKNLTATYHREGTIPEDLKEGIEWKSLILPDIPNSFDIVRDKDWVIHAAGLVSYNHEDRYRL
ncbi:MAG: NAD-dependent epimerase/dehydratase family protein, partial [Saprospiraceae bacterium]